MKEYRFVGDHADDLDGGRPLEPGEYTGAIDETLPKNAQMIEDGLLIEVRKGTADKNQTEVDEPVVDPVVDTPGNDEDEGNGS